VNFISLDYLLNNLQVDGKIRNFAVGKREHLRMKECGTVKKSSP